MELTLPLGPVSVITTEKTTKKTTEKTTEKILEALRTDPYLSNKELAGLCGITVDGVYYNIKKLKNTGRLKRIGADNGGYWEVLD